MRALAGGAAVLAALAVAAPAVAQDSGGGDRVLSPRGEALSYGANPSRTGEASEPAVFGPLYEEWQVSSGFAVDQPLVADGKILVNVADSSASSVVALDPRDGSTLWSQTVFDGYAAAPIAAADGVVVSLAPDGVVRAFSVADGKPLWTHTLVGDQPRIAAAPVADEVGVYLLAGPLAAGSGTLRSLSLSTGAVRWVTEVPVEAERGAPALYGQRVLATDHCGRTAAVFADTGAAAWPRDPRVGPCRLGAYARVSDGRLFSGNGRTYSTTTGFREGELRVQPEAISGSLAFSRSGGSITAIDAVSGAERWGYLSSPYRVPSAPLVVGGTVFIVSDETTSTELVGLERSTGKKLSRHRYVGGKSHGPLAGGMAAGAGRLIVAGASTLTAYRAVLEPPPDGLDIAAKRFDVRAGSSVPLVGGMGAQIRAKDAPIELRAQAMGSSQRQTVATGQSHEDGTAYFRTKVARNTDFRVAHGAAESQRLPVFAYPAYRMRGKPVSRSHARLNVQVRKVPAAALRKRRAFVYWGRKGSASFKRLGGSRLRPAGRMMGRASVKFRVPKRLRGKDNLVPCVRGLARAGWGRNIGIDRHCGKRRLRDRTFTRLQMRRQGDRAGGAEYAAEDHAPPRRPPRILELELGSLLDRP